MSNNITANKRARILMRDKGMCWYCGQYLDMSDSINWRRVREHKNAAVIDHVVPLSRGGDSSDENLVASCWRCNNEKKSKSVEEFREFILLQSYASFRSLRHLQNSRFEHETPFDSEIQRAVEWLYNKTPPVIFHGEQKQVED